ncbi:MAG: lipoyl(octanoyl) transferase LipB [Candidatus Tantalella remota]|nr:lipoyl(octanoyl) transferase LipB [Candidatus Tantalella remota]
MATSCFNICDLGKVGYEDALKRQEDLLRQRMTGEVGDTLLILEHLPVVTLGRLADEKGVFDPDYFNANGIPVIRTSRGGDVTCHVPGQLVIYPIVDLRARGKRISGYIDLLEDMVCCSLEELKVPASRIDGKRGVWVHGKKIAFIGIAVKRWVTYHGIAVNISNDITPFSHMHPCGEKEISVTSAEECLGEDLDMGRVKKIFIEHFISGLGETLSEEETLTAGERWM